ncbi:Putative CDP-alcohol phosphatidyltransferase class-I family protein [Tolypocladium paradoxum]|uniref:CDP-alcohol phosphatidyltransferase class-I family protein n=1 Tax=Tolypocladium paradoxum TaxID=94208 RepID=A0A2S4LB00_9HYPO|nr:Putative CDP-alcohol phosphatidyltransferase class-I family protein [Tolypocladium paradoxum]
MPSFRSVALATAATFVAVAHADYVIDPKSVPLGTRQVWCTNEKNTCPLICQQMEPRTTLVNDCDPEQLTYGCLCGNNKRPNVSEYTLSLPYFICQEWGNQCVKKCGQSNTCASDCREKHPCGATDPKRNNTTSTASGSGKPTASKTDGSDTIFTDGPGGGSSGSKGDKSGASMALEVGRTCGLAIVLTSLFASFALL